MSLLFDLIKISTQEQASLSQQEFVERLQKLISTTDSPALQQPLNDILNLFNDKTFGKDFFDLYINNSDNYDKKFEINLLTVKDLEKKVSEYLTFIVAEFNIYKNKTTENSKPSYEEISEKFSHISLHTASVNPEETTQPVAEAKKIDMKPVLQILVAEDDLGTSKVYKRFFQNISNELLKNEKFMEKFSKVDCTFVINGKEAIENAKNKEFNFILTDNMMPGANGTEVIAAIRNDSKNQKTPILANSDDKTSKTEKKMMENGATQFTKKPLVQKNIFDFLDSYVLSEQVEEIESQRPSSP